MPYIDQVARTELIFDRGAETPGELAYILYSQCLEYYDLNYHVTPSFTTLNEIVGVLDNVKDEFKRRHLFPYEDQKLLENGDVD